MRGVEREYGGLVKAEPPIVVVKGCRDPGAVVEGSLGRADGRMPVRSGVAMGIFVFLVKVTSGLLRSWVGRDGGKRCCLPSNIAARRLVSCLAVPKMLFECFAVRCLNLLLAADLMEQVT